GSATKQLQQKAPVHITIDEKGKIVVNKENFDLQTFGDNFYLFSQKLDKEATVLISADKTLDYGVVMSVLGAVKRAGFTEVSLATSG
ncbi:biopolymer transporter ExbD, partial [bacterium]|nr:biopolymer transporter ExbD [bacterium]